MREMVEKWQRDADQLVRTHNGTIEAHDCKFLRGDR